MGVPTPGLSVEGGAVSGECDTAVCSNLLRCRKGLAAGMAVDGGDLKGHWV